MGVSGCGKTTIGSLLANKIDFPFYDADDFHPKSNVEKMKSGQPLNDDDRKPWLQILSKKIEEWNNKKGAVLACSALKKKYRTLLASNPGPSEITFVYLKGSKTLIANRLQNRKDHYMPPNLLDSQFEDLEEPETAITISIDQTPKKIVSSILKQIKI